MESQYPKYYDIKYDLGVASLKEVQSTLSSETLMISYFVTSDELFTSYISKDTMQIFRLPKDRDYEKWIIAFRKGLLYRSQSVMADYGLRIYNQLFPGEIDSRYKKIIIIQDGLMSTIPFEALPTQKVARGTDYRDFPFLIKNYEVSYAYSANLLYKTFNNQKIVRPKAEKQLYAIAPVEFEDQLLETFRQIKTNSYEESAKAKSEQTGIGFTSLPTLPGTEQELNVIKTYFDPCSIQDLFEENSH